MHLRSHVLNGAKLGLEDTGSIFAFHRSGESKIVDLQLVSRIKQNIFDFDVAVSDATLVTVLKAFEESLEIEASYLL